jgi:hypothetical protein
MESSTKKGPCRIFLTADMAELADALGSGPSGRKAVEVRVLLSAPEKQLSAPSSQVSVKTTSTAETQRAPRNARIPWKRVFR